MQRFALDKNGCLIEALSATSHEDYLCPDCLLPVRVKKGLWRAHHFFHVSKKGVCRFKKSSFHKECQEFIQKELGKEHVAIEQPFPEISRIADIAYQKKKCIIEIQCSPFDYKKALERTLDYWSLGWHVLWLLSRDTFGQEEAYPLEEALNVIPHYFLEKRRGSFIIFDEASYAFRGKRHPLLKDRKKVNIRDLVLLKDPPPSIPFFTVPKTFSKWQEERKKHWSFHLRNDFLFQSFSEKKQKEKRFCMKTFLKLVSLHLLRGS